MIRITKKITHPAPKILTTRGVTATAELKLRFENGQTHFASKDFDTRIYGHKEVRDLLGKLQDEKCCFCESNFKHTGYGDVEHYRPKAGWVQDKESLNRPGYYWLAYDWDNLLLSCQICNQQHKKNLFPLFNPKQRSASHLSNIKEELPVFIHPVNDNPENFITFKDEIPVAVDGNMRGLTSIQKLGLDRDLLNRERMKTLNMIRDIYELAKDTPITPPENYAKSKAIIEKYYQSSLKDETEYASMLRSFFRDNPIDF